MKKYTIEFTEGEMEFFRQLFASDIPVTLKMVEPVASAKAKISSAKPQKEPADNPVE
jgi:hypothetical protein